MIHKSITYSLFERSSAVQLRAISSQARYLFRILNTYNSAKFSQLFDVIAIARPCLFFRRKFRIDELIELQGLTSMMLGTPIAKSLFESTIPFMTESGVGRVGGVLGSKVVTMSPAPA